MALQGSRDGLEHRTTKRPDEAKGGHSSTSLSWLRVTLDDGRAWMPIRGFRLAQTYCGNDLPRTEFLSSGSTQAVRARHAFSADALKVYACDATKAFVSFLESAGFHRQSPLVSLVPPPAAWPTSSLAAMLAFFAQEGLPLVRLDVESHDASPSALLSLLNSLAQHDEGRVVVFGTSVHHILVARALASPLFDAREHFTPVKKLLVIDTGGTKGRTEAFSKPDFLALLRSTYEPLCESLVLGSEYGMCELASQAYALFPEEQDSSEASNTALQDGTSTRLTFTCNAGLQVSAVDLRQRRILPAGEVGFLAFEDQRNGESERLVVTEDLGRVDSAGRFELLGRAPDATLKGCSLNVKTGFLFGSAERSNSHFHTSPSLPFEAAKILESLHAKGVSAGLREDLKAALQSVEEHWPAVVKLRASVVDAQKGAPSLCVVSSANVPVVFLYPLVHAWSLGCERFDLKLPSLREDDSLSARVRFLQGALLEIIAPCFEGMLISTSSSLDSFDVSNPARRYLVFGTDATCSVFESRFGKRVSALGEVVNALDLADTLPSAAACLLSQACQRFFGRGCLTPVAAFVCEGFDAGAFAEELSAGFLERLTSEGPEVETQVNWMHAQDMLEIRYLLAQAGHANPASCLREEAAAWVVDLRDVPAHFDFEKLPWSLGGSGLVFLLPEKAKPACSGLLSVFPPNPGLYDPHLGEAWRSRLERLFA
ncbi:MAG: hypothetical protein IOD12_02205 [Silvanigrellales bacterium]|nr:hypothetical protein [Silvanigrellales bacterium]